MCAIVVWMYVIAQDNASSSIVSPVGVLSVRDALEVFEMREVELIKSSYDVDVDKFRGNFLKGISVEMKEFVLADLIVDGRPVGDVDGFFENILYPDRLTFPKGDDLHFGRAKVEKMKVLKPVKSKNYFPVDFSFEFERSYVVSEVGGKVRVVKV